MPFFYISLRFSVNSKSKGGRHLIWDLNSHTFLPKNGQLFVMPFCLISRIIAKPLHIRIQNYGFRVFIAMWKLYIFFELLSFKTRELLPFVSPRGGKFGSKLIFFSTISSDRKTKEGRNLILFAKKLTGFTEKIPGNFFAQKWPGFLLCLFVLNRGL